MQRHAIILIGSDSLPWNMVRHALMAIDGVRVAGDFLEARHGIAAAIADPPGAIFVEAAEDGARPEVRALLADLAAHCPRSALIVVARTIRSWELVDLVAIGVRGLLLWRDLDLAAIRQCVDAVIQGRLVVASGSLRAELAGAGIADAPVPGEALGLSARERTVLDGLAQGWTQPRIAAASRLSVRTVKRVVADLELKLQAPSAFALGVRARSLGLVPTAD